MNKEQLQEVLRLHKLHLEGHKDGVRADLQGVNFEGADLWGVCLEGVNLYKADLEGANLEEANLKGADLRWADLRWANLKGADLEGANLEEVNLRWVNLKEANLKEANLEGADLERAYLSGADLEGANLEGANLEGASLRDVKNIPDHVLKATLITPEGDLTGYKKCRGGMIVTLLIPSDSPRHNATTNKCRAKYAKVISIKDREGNPVDAACSAHQSTFKYAVGRTVVADNYDPDRFNECAGGIHFFLTEKEAREY